MPSDTVRLERSHAVEVAFLAIATIYCLTIPLRRTITLVDAKQQKTVLPRKEIDEVKASTASLMPEGLLDPLKDEQVRDLFRFLQSNGASR